MHVHTNETTIGQKIIFKYPNEKVSDVLGYSSVEDHLSDMYEVIILLSSTGGKKYQKT